MRHYESQLTPFFGLRYNIGMTSKYPALPAPTVDSLANQFCQLLRSTLTAEQMHYVVTENRTETNLNVCHSGDFCDSNMVLHEVFMRYGMDVADRGGAEEWGCLWDAAWSLAKTRDFTMFKRGDNVEIVEAFQDPGDDSLTWVVEHDEERGRVDVVPFEMTGSIKLRYTFKIEWIRIKSAQVH